MTAVDERPSRVPEDINADLGFGTVVSRESRQRLLNRNGSFNVRRDGLSVWQTLSPYHYFLTMSWSKFLSLIALVYVLANMIFAFAYLACGDNALSGFQNASTLDRFRTAFFFSVETIATIGYGTIAPVSLAANLVMTVESLIGLLGFAVAAGIVFARFARPTAQIIFSRSALIGPYRNMTAFMFRIVNQRTSELVDLQARVLFTRRKKGKPSGEREFIQLKLERERVAFFPLAWTIVHPIDEDSPLRSYRTPQELEACESEFLVLLNGFDETFSQTVHTRSSYKGSEVVWGARFISMFNPTGPDGRISIDVGKLHEIEPAAIPV